MNAHTISVQLTPQEFDLLTKHLDMSLIAFKNSISSGFPELAKGMPSFLRSLPGFDSAFNAAADEALSKRRKEIDDMVLLSGKLIDAKRRSESTNQTNQEDERS